MFHINLLVVHSGREIFTGEGAPGCKDTQNLRGPPNAVILITHTLQFFLSLSWLGPAHLSPPMPKE